MAAPIINAPGTLSRSQARQLIGLIAVFEELFGTPGNPFCGRQPICEQVRQRAVEAVQSIAAEVCAQGRAQPDLSSAVELIALQREQELLGGEDFGAHACVDQIVTSVVGLATFGACGDPFGASSEAADLPPGGEVDIDGDGQITNFEFLTRLGFELTEFGLPELAARAQADALACLAQFPDRGRARCESDRAGGEADLRRGLAYATEFNQVTGDLQHVIDRFVEALDACRVEVQVSPAAVTLEPGDEQQFTAAVSGAQNQAVTWSASGGAVDQAGRYTAPTAPGTYSVTARSVVNPERRASATVTVEGSCPAPEGVAANAFPGENGRIAFVRSENRSSSGDIVTMDPDGSDETNLTPGAAHELDPAWSPDGRRIAFVRREVGSSVREIHVMDADGSDVVNLHLQGQRPAWSPDGEKIVFNGQGSAQFDSDLFVVNSDGSPQPDGSTHVNLTSTATTNEGTAAWSPDGTEIAFAGGTGIFVMNADGSPRPDGTARTRLTTGNDAFPNWSPDGRTIVFEGVRDVGRDKGIFVTNADGTPQPGGAADTRLAAGDWNEPAYSPDGSKIVAEGPTRYPAEPLAEEGAEIWGMNADGSEQAPITLTPADFNASIDNMSPDWGPVPC